MKGFSRWLLPLLILIEIVLVRLNVINLASAVVIIVLFEVSIALVVSRQFIVAAKAYSAKRKQGQGGWAAFAEGLEAFLPRGLAKAVVLEIQMWYFLGRWVFRRNRPSKDQFTYHKESRLIALIVILIFATPAELFLLSLIIPWGWLEWLLGISAVYAFFWVVGMHASMVALPHRLCENSLEIHYAVLGGGEIPYRNIESVSPLKMTDGPSGDGLKVRESEKAAYFSISGETNFELVLSEPVVLDNWINKTVPINKVYLAVDDPGKMAAAVRERLRE